MYFDSEGGHQDCSLYALIKKAKKAIFPIVFCTGKGIKQSKGQNKDHGVVAV